LAMAPFRAAADGRMEKVADGHLDGARIQRNGTRELILQTQRSAPDRLKVVTNALVTKVLFADQPDADGHPRATGVELLDGAHLYRADPRATSAEAERVQVTVSREVILSAGTFNTPQLL